MHTHAHSLTHSCTAHPHSLTHTRHHTANAHCTLHKHTQMDTFCNTEKKLRQDIRRRKDNFTELKHDTQEEIARLMEDKKEYRTQLELAREEYDCLKVLQSQQMSDFQQSLSMEKVVSRSKGKSETEMLYAVVDFSFVSVYYLSVSIRIKIDYRPARKLRQM